MTADLKAAPPPPRWRSAPILAALALVVATTALGWSGRRLLVAAVRVSPESLDRVPTAFAGWRGEADKLDERTLRTAKVDGSWLRRYTNQSSGEVVSVFVLWGKPEHILAHGPEVCYPAHGYAPTGPTGRYSTGGATFYSAKFSKRDADVPTLLHVLWSWNMRGRWEGPDQPELTFANAQSLAKIYFVFETTGEGLDPHGVTAEFLRLFMSELNDAIPSPR